MPTKRTWRRRPALLFVGALLVACADRSTSTTRPGADPHAAGARARSAEPLPAVGSAAVETYLPSIGSRWALAWADGGDGGGLVGARWDTGVTDLYGDWAGFRADRRWARVTSDSVAVSELVDDVGVDDETWLDAPIAEGRRWTDWSFGDLRCEHVIERGPHRERSPFAASPPGEPGPGARGANKPSVPRVRARGVPGGATSGEPWVEPCIEVRMRCTSQETTRDALTTWCAGLGVVRETQEETTAGRTTRRTRSLVRFNSSALSASADDRFDCDRLLLREDDLGECARDLEYSGPLPAPPDECRVRRARPGRSVELRVRRFRAAPTPEDLDAWAGGTTHGETVAALAASGEFGIQVRTGGDVTHAVPMDARLYGPRPDWSACTQAQIGGLVRVVKRMVEEMP